MPKAVVINCSHPHYNLGCEKLTNWLIGQGYSVCNQTLGEADLVCLSVIFTWDAPKALKYAEYYKGKAEIWIGGPGIFKLQNWWFEKTGGNVSLGLDPRFERQPGSYRMTFASRGCPIGCHFCIVPQFEGKKFTMYWDFTPAPILCDNNLSDLPFDFQQHIVKRYQETGTQLLDANSGFEPHAFTEDTFELWKPILRGPWRFAFDIMPEWRSVQNMMRILKDENVKKKRVYVLVGNEPIASCYERARKVLEWGGEPYCQPEMPLDTLDKRPRVRFDWTEQLLGDFARYFNRFLWKSCDLKEYSHRVNERPPFERIAL